MSADAASGVTLIVACAHGGVIGRDNQLPWRLPEDLRHFKTTTQGHALIMGRKTFESIGRPLPGRITIVLSRAPDWHADGCLAARSLAQAIEMARERTPSEVFVAGGDQIYRQALPIATRVLCTEIDLAVAGDAWFPALPPDQWQVVSRQAHTAGNGTRFAIVDYRRVEGTA